MCRHFIDCIKTGKKPISDGNSGLKVIKVIESLQESLRNHGKEVIIDAVDFQSNNP